VLFLDRDGVIIEDRHYLADPEDVKLVPGAAAALARARRAGYTLVGVSNQSGLGRGRFGTGDLARVMTRLDELLAAAGAPLDAFHYCPHAPEDGCDCRKPRLGLLREASHRTPWIPGASWVVGDKPSDVELGRAADLGAVLVRTGYGRASEQEVRARWRDDPRVLVAEDLGAAVEAILARNGGKR
jgi:D-glycero-D-manno-heptose 1,7-bisphosphate phosphatase